MHIETSWMIHYLPKILFCKPLPIQGVTGNNADRYVHTNMCIQHLMKDYKLKKKHNHTFDRYLKHRKKVFFNTLYTGWLSTKKGCFLLFFYWPLHSFEIWKKLYNKPRERLSKIPRRPALYINLSLWNKHTRYERWEKCFRQSNL